MSTIPAKQFLIAVEDRERLYGAHVWGRGVISLSSVPVRLSQLKRGLKKKQKKQTPTRCKSATQLCQGGIQMASTHLPLRS